MANVVDPFEQELLKRTAASKGFQTINEHKYYLMKQYPNWCGILYNYYARIANCEGKNNEHCATVRSMLLADCQAVENGSCISFPDDSHPEYKEFNLEQSIKVQAELHGLPEDRFIRMSQKQYEMMNPKQFKHL